MKSTTEYLKSIFFGSVSVMLIVTQYLDSLLIVMAEGFSM